MAVRIKDNRTVLPEGLTRTPVKCEGAVQAWLVYACNEDYPVRTEIGKATCIQPGVINLEVHYRDFAVCGWKRHVDQLEPSSGTLTGAILALYAHRLKMKKDGLINEQ